MRVKPLYFPDNPRSSGFFSWRYRRDVSIQGGLWKSNVRSHFYYQPHAVFSLQIFYIFNHSFHKCGYSTKKRQVRKDSTYLYPQQMNIQIESIPIDRHNFTTIKSEPEKHPINKLSIKYSGTKKNNIKAEAVFPCIHKGENDCKTFQIQFGATPWKLVIGGII